MSRRTLIRGGCVLTLGAKTPNYDQGDVLLQDGRVAEVGRGLRARDAEVVDARDTIVMPGFVDAHRHVWKTLLRNTGGVAHGDAGAPPAGGEHYRPDDVYAATVLGLLSAAEAGITTVVDWSDIQVDEQYTDAALQAHTDAGVRSVFVHALPAWAPDADDWLRRAGAPRDGLGPLTSLAVGPRDPRPDTVDHVAADWSRARELGLRIHAHAGVRPSDVGVIAALADRGLLGPDVTLAHCSHLGNADLDALAASGTSVVLTPANEMATGRGFPPLQQLIDRGIQPGLGVDDELLAPGDLFAQMRSAHSLQHATLFDRKLAGKAGVPNLLSTRQVIRYATAEGAHAAGLGEVTGSLEPGRQADIVMLRTDRPNIAPVNDPIGAVVWGLDASNVDWVFVAGRPLVRDGVLDADVQRVRDAAMAARARVAAAADQAAPAVPRASR